MASLDPAGELLRISEHYRQMTDGEVLAIARESSELTPIAQDALADEIRQRKLRVQPEESPAPESSEPTEPSVYDEDRELVELCTVWSVPDALQVQTLLDRGGIPFFMGSEKATGVDAVTSDFAKGVSVQVMRIGLAWAALQMKDYEPANDPDAKETDISEVDPVRCPRCHSTEVVFEDLVAEPATTADKSPRYKWTCDSCGHHWEDDGIVKEG